MRFVIDSFFTGPSGIIRIIMEADEPKRLSGSWNPARLLDSARFSLRGQGRFLELFRIAGHRLVRRQALVMPRSEYRGR